MAEALLKYRLPHLEVSSAGLYGMVDHPADSHALELLSHRRGIDYSSHRARQLTPHIVESAELVLVMETGHIKEALRQVPIARGRIHLFGKWNNMEIPDPYRQDRHVFEDVFNMIETCLDIWQEKIWSQ